MKTGPSVFLKNLNWIFFCNLISGILNFGSLAWFARNLGPKVIGDYAILFTCVQLVASVLSAGFDQALIKMPNDSQISRAANFCTIIQVLVLILLTSFIGVYYGYHGQISTNEIYPAGLILLSIVLSQFTNLLGAPLAAGMDYRFLAVTRLGSSLFGVFVGIFATFLNAGVFALVLRDISFAFVTFIFVFFRTNFLFECSSDFAGLKRLWEFSKGLWIINSAEKICIRLDYSMVGILLGKESLGVYYVVRGFVEGILGFLIYPIQTVLFSYYCRSMDGVGKIFGNGRFIFGFFGAVVFIAVLVKCFGLFLFVKLIGDEYVLAFTALPVFLIYAGAIIWYENIKSIAMSRGFHLGLIYPRVVQLLVFLLVLSPLVRIFGLVGASIATALGGLTLSFISTIYLKSYLKSSSTAGYN